MGAPQFKICSCCGKLVEITFLDKDTLVCISCGEIVDNFIPKYLELSKPKKYRKNSKHLKNRDNLTLF